MSQFDESVCRNLDVAIHREWLETNGIGGFASSTITGLNTRRYHGLLVAATKPPVGRMVLLSKLEETLIVEGRRFDLSCNRYPGVIHPQGHMYLKQFRQDPFPVFVYEVDGLELEKSVFMVHGENTTVIQYELRGAASRRLHARTAAPDCFPRLSQHDSRERRAQSVTRNRTRPRDVFALPGMPEPLPRPHRRRSSAGRRLVPQLRIFGGGTARPRLPGGSLQSDGDDLRSAPRPSSIRGCFD